MEVIFLKICASALEIKNEWQFDKCGGAFIFIIDKFWINSFASNVIGFNIDMSMGFHLWYFSKFDTLYTKTYIGPGQVV